MFDNIPLPILRQMRRLEKIDASDRTDGTDRQERLRQIPPETGRFLAIIAASVPSGTMIEIGTSGGYSGLWLSLACRAGGRGLSTFELLEKKASLARETFALAEVEDVVKLVVGDARDCLNDYSDIAFCFLDAEKEVYHDCYELVIPKMVSGGLLVADNVISHADELQPFVNHAMADIRVDAVVVPIGKGLLLARVP